MVAITGIGSTSGPGPERPERDSIRKTSSDGALSLDGVEISDAAKEAADVQQLPQIDVSQSAIRAERVNQAKENIEEGRHKVEAVVDQVAAILVKYI